MTAPKNKWADIEKAKIILHAALLEPSDKSLLTELLDELAHCRDCFKTFEVLNEIQGEVEGDY